MYKLRLLITLTAFVTLIVACTNNQESQTRNTDKIDVEQSSYEPDNIMDRNDIADHLANLAVKTNHVNDAAAIVVGRSEEHTSDLQSRFDIVCRLARLAPLTFPTRRSSDLAFVTLIVACTNNQESQTRNTDKIDVEQSSYEPDNIMDRNDIADHLANLAVKTNHVNDAAAIVVG